jgi:DNA-binding MarR family transcriptional regulator
MNTSPPQRAADAASRLLRWILLLSRRLRRDGAKDKLPFPAASLQILGILRERPAATATELAAELGVKKQSLTVLLSALHAKRYLGRHREPGDARRISLSLTAAGRDVFLGALGVRRAVLERRIEENLSATEAADLVRALPVLEKLLREPGGEPGQRP